MEVRRVHHVGIAVRDLDEAVETYRRLFGGRLELRDVLEEQGVEAASLHVGESRIELLAPTGGDTPVGRFLEGRGPGLHHVAYEVEDVALALAGLAANGVALAGLAANGVALVDHEPRRGLFGLQVAFIHPDAVHGVLTEVVSVA
jgi:methylmalonyl-CoA epimerase